MIPEVDRNALQALAAFVPLLRDRQVSFGEWSEPKGTGTPDDPIIMPHYTFSELGTRFINSLYRDGWIDTDLDWSTWSRTAEAKLLFNVRAIPEADLCQLRRVLTTLVRQDRFVEGALAEAYDAGLLVAIAERAAVLLLGK